MGDSVAIGPKGSLSVEYVLSGSVGETVPMAPVDPELDEGSGNAVANSAVVAALRLKLDKASTMTNGDIAGLFHS